MMPQCDQHDESDNTTTVVDVTHESDPYWIIVAEWLV